MSTHLSEEILHAYLDGDLAWEARQRVREHVLTCETCRQRLESLRQAEYALRQIPTFSVPTDFTAQVMQRIRAVSPPLWRQRSFVWAAHGLVLLGVVLLGLAAAESVTLSALSEQGLSLLTLDPTLLVDPLLLLDAMMSLFARVVDGLMQVGETVVPLGVGLLAMGSFLEMVHWLGRMAFQPGVEG